MVKVLTLYTFSDADPPLDEILESITLYWMTDTFPRCIYPYRGVSLISSPRASRPRSITLLTYSLPAVRRRRTTKNRKSLWRMSFPPSSPLTKQHIRADLCLQQTAWRTEELH